MKGVDAFGANGVSGSDQSTCLFCYDVICFAFE